MYVFPTKSLLQSGLILFVFWHKANSRKCARKLNLLLLVVDLGGTPLCWGHIVTIVSGFKRLNHIVIRLFAIVFWFYSFRISHSWLIYFWREELSFDSVIKMRFITWSSIYGSATRYVRPCNVRSKMLNVEWFPFFKFLLKIITFNVQDLKFLSSYHTFPVKFPMLPHPFCSLNVTKESTILTGPWPF